MFYLICAATGLILLLAAKGMLNRFRRLAAVLGREEFLPRQLSYRRGDHPAYASATLLAWLGAVAFIVGFQASTTRLLALYIVGVFISLSLSQIALVRFWNRQLSSATDPKARTRMRRARAINTGTAAGTSLVLLIIVATKLTSGAWLSLLVIAVFYLVMDGVHAHYVRINQELEIPKLSKVQLRPAHVHAIVLASSLDRPTLRALTYAQSAHPTRVEALSVEVGDGRSQLLLDDWQQANLPVPLTILDSPLGGLVAPLVSYVRSLRRDCPGELIVIFLPEYFMGYWWAKILHNHMARRIKTALVLTPGVVVATVPWSLGNAETAIATAEN